MNCQLSTTIIVLLCFVTLQFSNVRCAPNTTYVGSGSSVEKYEEGSDYGDEIDQGLEALTYGVATTANLQMTLTGQLAKGFAYCQLNLLNAGDDCTECLKASNEFLREDFGCAYAMSAYVVLVDCGMSYGPIQQQGS